MTFAPVYQALGYSPVAARSLAQGLGLSDLTQEFVAPAGAVPADPRMIDSDVTPHLRASSNSVTLQARQRLNEWLSATVIAAYADRRFFSNQS